MIKRIMSHLNKFRLNKKKTMRIALFTDTFTPQLNGVVTSTIDLAKGLADKGHKVFIIAPKFNNVKEFKHPNIKVRRVSAIPAKFYEDFKFTQFNIRLYNYLGKEKIDLIHFQTPISLGMQAIVMSKLLKKPLVGTYHTSISDLQYLKHVGLDYKFIQKFSWIYSRFFYNKCDLITCPSESMRRELLAHEFSKEIKTISNGIDLKIFDNTNAKSVKNKFNKDGDLVLFVGRIAYEKNIFYLLDCFKLVAKNMPKVKFLIVGSGPQMSDFKERIAKLKLEDKIIILGRVEHANLVRSGIFGACKVFTTASLTETQGITLLEAQANAMVGVGVDAKGTKDLIIDGYNGYLVKKGDKKLFAKRIIAILTDKKLYEKMKKNTSKEIKKHDLKQVINTWEKTYFKLIVDKKSGKL